MEEEIPKNEVDEFLDLVENKYAIKIKLEANTVIGPIEVFRGFPYREKTLGAMFWKVREQYRNNSAYYNDLRKVISSIKLQGFYEETEGLPKKYGECVDKLEVELKRNRELRKEMETLIEKCENLKTENTNMKTELDVLRGR